MLSYKAAKVAFDELNWPDDDAVTAVNIEYVCYCDECEMNNMEVGFE